MAASMINTYRNGTVRCKRLIRCFPHFKHHFLNSAGETKGMSYEIKNQKNYSGRCGVVFSLDNLYGSVLCRRFDTAHAVIVGPKHRIDPTKYPSVGTCTRTKHAAGHQNFAIDSWLNKPHRPGVCVRTQENGCKCLSNFDQQPNSKTTSNRSGNTLKVIGIFAALFFKKETEEESVESLVAKAVASEQKGHMDKAEDFYHLAIELAKQENRHDKVVYIYDMMANFNLKINKYLKAEQLFKETIKLLLEAGFVQHDPAVLEISLKLAGIYDLQYRYTEAEAGFQFCVSKAEEGLKIFKEKGEEDIEQEMNLYAMLGVSLDAYGKFMLKRKHYDVAEDAYIRAIKICENELADKGRPHPQTATLLNDLGTVYEQKKNYKKAMEMVCRAEKLAQDSPDNLAVILCNKASLLLRNGDREEATGLFRRALRLAEKSQDDETIIFVRIAMSKLAAPLRKTD